MDVSIVGLGKLGLPVAVAMTLGGHRVWGYDVDQPTMERYKSLKTGLHEPHIDELLQSAVCQDRLMFSDLRTAVQCSEIIFVAVPTPSKDDDSFETQIVVDALRAIAQTIKALDDGRYRVIALISTVLAGTCRNEFYPHLIKILGEPHDWGFVYSPQFIAMGTVIRDYLNPEFCLLGSFHERAGNIVLKFYESFLSAPVLEMTPESAEMTKVIYNVMIGLKIVYANTIMEMCANVPGADAEVVVDALKRAHDRLISTRYLSPGLGDGGPCHPRDQRALAWQADQFDLSTNVFRFISEARIAQSEWLAKEVVRCATSENLPVAILGLTFKPETNLVVDSPATLLLEQISERMDGQEIEAYDPIILNRPLEGEHARCYVLAMRHPELKTFHFAPGSIIVDPWAMLDSRPYGCAVYQPGRQKII